MNSKQVVITFLSVVSGIILMFGFNYFFLEKYIIPDYCYYHNHTPSDLMKLFYEFTSAENFHPFPSTFNLILTATAGSGLGFVSSRLAFRIFRSLEAVIDE